MDLRIHGLKERRQEMSVNAGQRKIADTPANRQLYALSAVSQLVDHTLNICSNEKIFDPKFNEVLMNDVLRTVKDIYIHCIDANNIYVKNIKDFEIRNDLQKAAIRECKRMLALISLCRRLYHLRNKKVTYWSEMTIKTRNYLNKWHESDVQRYKKQLDIK